MFRMFMEWYRRRFSDPHAITLFIFLLLLFLLIYFFHQVLSPILIAVVMSYLLESPVKWLCRLGLPRVAAVSIVLIVFIILLLAASAVLLPLIWQQVVSLMTNIPTMLNTLNQYLSSLPHRYPELIDVAMFDSVIDSIRNKVVESGDSLLKFSIASLFGVLSGIISSVLIPILVFFLLKDKQQILQYCTQFMPRNRRLMHRVAYEMNIQIHNYINGTVLQIILLSLAIYIPFWYFKLDYGLLLALMVGLSVIIPYIGLIVVTIPVVLIALFQWGVSAQFGYLMLWYTIIQLLNGNVIVPFLFSEALNLHPLVIILAIIIFGGLWGFWGVFFAIPLATLLKALISAWPGNDKTRLLDKKTGA